MTSPTQPLVMLHCQHCDRRAVVYANEPFTVSGGNRMRAVRCLICSDMIEGRPAVGIIATTPGGGACQCESSVSDVFLVHAEHLPMPSAELQSAIDRGLQSSANH